MNKRILSIVALGAVFSAAVLNGCGGESGPPADPSESVIATAARNLEDRDDDDERDDDDRDGRDGHRDDDDRERRYKARFIEVFDALRAVPALAPLFERYQVPDPVEYDEHDRGLVALLRAVRIRVDGGIVTIKNRRTGGVVFSAPLDALGDGVFHPDQMPGGGGVPPPPPVACAFDYSAWSACGPDGTQTRTVLASSPDGCTGTPVTSRSCTYLPPAAACTSFTYSPWGACRPDGTQTRTVTGSSPAGCTGGSPVTSQACTYTPPVLDGAALFTQKCSPCHGPLATTDRRGKTAAQILAKHPTIVTAAEAEAIAAALAPTTPPPPATCTSFSYSAWGACRPDGTQTRTVVGSFPAGCTGGSPATSQACTYVPPVTTCTSFTYSAWGACRPDGTQTRTVTGSAPAGCTGGSPITSQACTYTPPACTYTYSAWSACSAGGTQTRTVTGSSPAGCAGTPVLSQSCTPPPPPTASCTTCHGIPPSTGRHSRHTSFASCATCHGTGYSTTTANPATHQNGVKNLTTTIGWSATTRSCANSCHGSKSW